MLKIEKEGHAVCIAVQGGRSEFVALVKSNLTEGET